jgi:hypothetical protein
LAKITNILLSKGVHLNVDLASKYYILSKDFSDTTKTITNESEFFGYKKTPVEWTNIDKEVLILKEILFNHLENISLQNPFLYPNPKRFHYPKFSTIGLLSVKNFTIEMEDEIQLLVFDEDILFDEIDKTQTLLLESKSGNKFYGITKDYGEKITFESESKITDKVPGKVISHRKNIEGFYEILIKWKYLSYDESTWVKLEQYKQLIIVKEYIDDNIL